MLVSQVVFVSCGFYSKSVPSLNHSIPPSLSRCFGTQLIQRSWNKPGPGNGIRVWAVLSRLSKNSYALKSEWFVSLTERLVILASCRILGQEGHEAQACLCNLGNGPYQKLNASAQVDIPGPLIFLCKGLENQLHSRPRFIQPLQGARLARRMRNTPRLQAGIGMQTKTNERLANKNERSCNSRVCCIHIPLPAGKGED